VLAEFGDDRNRFADARGLKAYAGASPTTRASGKKSNSTRRWVMLDRPNHAGYLWDFSAVPASSGAKAPWRRRRDQGDWHASARRNLFNRMIGRLYHCLQHGQCYDEAVAFPAAAEALASPPPCPGPEPWSGQ
jgi:transposase